MAGLMEHISLLSPHPDCPDYKGPLFVSIDSSIRPAAECDGMLGSMVLEGVLGTAFASAASETLGGWAGQFDWSNAADCASEYMMDRPANTNFKPGQNNVLCPLFRLHAMHEEMMAAYVRDLPRRMGLERLLAQYQRKLGALRKQRAYASFKMAA